jgi:hypothetical protein
MHINPADKAPKILGVLGNQDTIFFDAALQDVIVSFAPSANIQWMQCVQTKPV